MIDGKFDDIKENLKQKLKLAKNPMDFMSVICHWIVITEEDDTWDKQAQFIKDTANLVDEDFAHIHNMDDLSEWLLRIHNDYVKAAIIAIILPKE